MKKLLLFIILFSILILEQGISYSSQFGFEAKKAVNGGYEVSMPIIVDVQGDYMFNPKVYFKGTPIFTAPRGELFKELGSLNHLRFDGVVGGSIILLGGHLELETGFSYWWAGNDYGIPEGMDWDNAVRYYFQW